MLTATNELISENAMPKYTVSDYWLFWKLDRLESHWEGHLACEKSPFFGTL